MLKLKFLDVTRRIQQLAKKCGVDVSRLCAENVDSMADSDCKPALQLLLDLLQLVSVERDAAVDPLAEVEGVHSIPPGGSSRGTSESKCNV